MAFVFQNGMEIELCWKIIQLNPLVGKNDYTFGTGKKYFTSLNHGREKKMFGSDHFNGSVG